MSFGPVEQNYIDVKCASRKLEPHHVHYRTEWCHTQLIYNIERWIQYLKTWIEKDEEHFDMCFSGNKIDVFSHLVHKSYTESKKSRNSANGTDRSVANLECHIITTKNVPSIPCKLYIWNWCYYLCKKGSWSRCFMLLKSEQDAQFNQIIPWSNVCSH
jgi:hypothetical protein